MKRADRWLPNVSRGICGRQGAIPAKVSRIQVTSKGPKILEFNVRLGDPEAQTLLPLVVEPWWEIMAFAREGKMPHRLTFHQRRQVAVVVTRRGYPAKRSQNPLPFPMEKLRSLDLTLHPGRELYNHAGSWHAGNGRLLTLVASGQTISEARQRIYDVLSAALDDEGDFFYRKDIGLPMDV